MEEAIFKALTLYYGLDWLALACGMTGMYLITQHSRWGFVLSALGCLSGVVVAVMSLQIAYVVYNSILVFMMIRGFTAWGDNKPALIKIKSDR